MRRQLKTRLHRRSGKAITEWICILGLLGMGLIVASGLLGTNASTSLQTTATGVGDPAQLVKSPILKGNN